MKTTTCKKPSLLKNICLNQLFGRCQGCTEDMDTRHHPNNLDCPRFKPVSIGSLTIV